MTINKEQAVSDAMIEAGRKMLAAWLEQPEGSEADDIDAVSAIYLAMQAASHPLEQQQAVRMREALQGIVDSWDRNTHQREKHVESEYGPYWSPASAMVDSEFIAAARTALQGGE